MKTDKFLSSTKSRVIAAAVAGAVLFTIRCARYVRRCRKINGMLRKLAQYPKPLLLAESIKQSLRVEDFSNLGWMSDEDCKILLEIALINPDCPYVKAVFGKKISELGEILYCRLFKESLLTVNNGQNIAFVPDNDLLNTFKNKCNAVTMFLEDAFNSRKATEGTGPPAFKYA